MSVINAATNEILNNVSTGLHSYPAPAASDPANGDLYVPDYGTANVSVISTASDTVVATIRVGGAPVTPAYDPADGDIYFPNTLSHNLSIISGSTNKVVGTISNLSFSINFNEQLIADTPVYDPFTQEIYQPNSGNFTISVIKGLSFVRNITVGDGPATPLVDPVNGNLYVPILFVPYTFSQPNDTVVVVSAITSQVIANISVGLAPDTPVYDPVNGEIYVPNQENNTVSAINTTTNAGAANIIVSNLQVGAGGPVGPVFDPTNDELFVPIYGTDGIMSVIAAGPLSGTSGGGGGSGGTGGSGGSSSFLGLSGDGGYYLLAPAAAAVAAVVVSLLVVRSRRSSRGTAGRGSMAGRLPASAAARRLGSPPAASSAAGVGCRTTGTPVLRSATPPGDRRRDEPSESEGRRSRSRSV